MFALVGPSCSSRSAVLQYGSSSFSCDGSFGRTKLISLAFSFCAVRYSRESTAELLAARVVVVNAAAAALGLSGGAADGDDAVLNRKGE